MKKNYYDCPLMINVTLQKELNVKFLFIKNNSGFSKLIEKMISKPSKQVVIYILTLTQFFFAKCDVKMRGRNNTKAKIVVIIMQGL